MNGLSLLVALAALGVDVGWESTSSGQLAYTIRIEPVLVEKLGEGSAIESVVDRSDRGLRKFRVAVGPKNLQTERVAAATANEVEYGWRPNETGGIDYYVQINRERLETLARGIPLECEVHPDVPEIEKIYVFVGDTKLPRELPQGTPAIQPRGISTIGDSRGGVTPVSGTQTNLGDQRYGDRYVTPANTQANASDANLNNGFGNQSPQGNFGNAQTYGPAPSSNYRDQAASPPSRYGPYADTTLPVPPLTNNRTTDYDYNRNQYAPQQDLYNRSQTQQPYPPPVQTAALPQQPPYNPPPAQTVPVAVQQQPSSPPATANPSMEALTAMFALQQKQLEKATPPPQEPEKKSSKPLILTTLALFASIGANAYLGWLAWSFFWRFRDAASDLSRARSNAFPAGSVAGH